MPRAAEEIAELRAETEAQQTTPTAGPAAAAGVLYLVCADGAVVAAFDMAVPHCDDWHDKTAAEEHDAVVAEMTPDVDNLLQNCADIAAAIYLFATMADTLRHVQGRDVYVTQKPSTSWWDGHATVPDNVPYLFP